MEFQQKRLQNQRTFFVEIIRTERNHHEERDDQITEQCETKAKRIDFENEKSTQERIESYGRETQSNDCIHVNCP